MKLIHCADVHLDSPFTLTSPVEAQKRRTELRSDFSSLVLEAKKNECGLFIISGDLFDDSYITKDTADNICSAISTFPSCLFVIAPGNHDFYHEKSPYALIKWPDNVHIFRSDKMEYIDVPSTNVRVYGYAFTSDTMTRSPLEGFSVSDPTKINILAAHGDLGNPLSVYCPILEGDLAVSGIDYAALGHIHKASGLMKAGGTYYAYCGCLEGRGFDETGYKGAFLCDVTKEGTQIKPIGRSKKRYEIANVDVTGCRDMSAALGEIQKACAPYGDDTALRVVLGGLVPQEFEVDEELLRLAVTRPYYVEVKDETLPVYDAEILRSDGTMLGEFYRNIEPHLMSDDAAEREKARLAFKYGIMALGGKEIKMI